MVTALLGLLAWVLASTPDVDVNGVIGLDDARMQASAPASTSAPASASASDPASDLASAPASGLATICDAICVRRLLYKTAYSSASVGAGMAMDAMGTRAWCTSDDNKNWCPDTLNATLSAIAGRIIDGNGTAMPPDGSDVGAVARSLAEASRLAAIEAIVWAMHTVNGSTTPAVDNSTLAFSASSAAMKRARQAPAAGSGNSSSSDAVEKLKWTVWQLSQNETGTVDSGDLQTAMDAEPNLGSDQDQALGETTDDDDDGKKLLAGLTVGTGVPAALLGAFLGMKGCADPALCGPATAKYISRLFKASRTAVSCRAQIGSAFCSTLPNPNPSPPKPPRSTISNRTSPASSRNGSRRRKTAGSPTTSRWRIKTLAWTMPASILASKS